MATDGLEITRRKLLASGAGSLGFVGLAAGGARALASDPVAYDRTTLVDGDGVNLVVNWTEWYNGEPTGDTQGTPTDTNGQPVVTLENVLPGDTGRLAFGLTLGPETEASSAQLEMRLRAFDDRENGLIEPERQAGDDSPDAGELADHVRVFGWYDTGLTAGDTPIYGYCDGTFDGTVDEQLLDDTLAAVADGEWRTLDANPSALDDCLDAGESLCVVLEWELPDDLAGGNNAVQTDEVTFEIAFGAFECES